MNLKESLEWRYACKAMNGTNISDDKRNNILEAMRMAPTSLGVQPVKFYVIRDQKIKNDLVPIFNNQGQVEMSDSVIIIASKVKYDDKWLEHVMANFSQERNMEPQQLDAMTTGLRSYMSPMTDEQFAQWTTKQAYICLGFGLIAAAAEQVDSTPMEGFNYEALNKYLKLEDEGYQAAVALTIGYRDEKHDYLAGKAKVRLPLEEMVQVL